MKVVALDLDGTTVRSDGTIGARTQEMLRLVESLGGTVIAVTGRPPRWMEPVREAFGGKGLAICANGAVVIDLADYSVVEEHLIPAEAVADVINSLRAALPDLGFALELADDGGFVHESAYRPKFAMGLKPVERLPVVGARKLLARHAGMSSDELMARARQAVDEQTVVLTHSSGDGMLEISAAGVTKASALAAVCAGRSIEAADVVAFGDMPNDIPMIEWAGLGVAVANAHPLLLAVADEVCASNDDEGPADVIARLWS